MPTGLLFYAKNAACYNAFFLWRVDYALEGFMM